MRNDLMKIEEKNNIWKRTTSFTIFSCKRNGTFASIATTCTTIHTWIRWDTHIWITKKQVGLIQSDDNQTIYLQFHRMNQRIQEHIDKHLHYKYHHSYKRDYNQLKTSYKNKYYQSMMLFKFHSITWKSQCIFTVFTSETCCTCTTKTCFECSIIGTGTTIVTIDEITQFYWIRRIFNDFHWIEFTYDRQALDIHHRVLERIVISRQYW